MRLHHAFLLLAIGTSTAVRGDTPSLIRPTGSETRILREFAAGGALGSIRITYTATRNGKQSLEVRTGLFKAAAPSEALEGLPGPRWDAITLREHRSAPRNMVPGEPTRPPFVTIEVPLLGPSGANWHLTSVLFRFESPGRLTRQIHRWVTDSNGDDLQIVWRDWEFGKGITAEEALGAPAPGPAATIASKAIPPAVVQERTSPDGRTVVRITPGNSWGDVYGFSTRPKGPFATAEWYRVDRDARSRLRESTLLNPISPVDFVVTNDGRLVTLDNWLNTGNGQVVAIHSPDGRALKTFSLADLYSAADFNQLIHIHSSTLWRCQTPASVTLRSSTELWVDDALGGRFVFGLDTGTFEYMRGVSRCGALVALPAPQPVSDSPPRPITSRLPTLPWTEVDDGLQIALSSFRTRPGEETILPLRADIRNVSNADMPMSRFPGASFYAFEYEIDGTWYAFDDAPARHAGTGGSAEPRPSIPAASIMSFDLYVPISPRSPLLRLRAITGPTAGQPFEPQAGPHVIRVRTGRRFEPSRLPLTSNPVTVSFPASPQTDSRRQSITFTSSQGTSQGSFRFAHGPAGSEELIRQALERPAEPISAIVNAPSLQVLQPLPHYSLELPGSSRKYDPSLPANPDSYHHLFRSGDLFPALIKLYTAGTPSTAATRAWIDTTESDTKAAELFTALQLLSAMEPVRDGSFEPRLLRVTGDGFTPLLVIWLRSPTKPDLFFLPQVAASRGPTRMESGKLYSTSEFMAAARALPLPPQHDAQWAAARAAACAAAVSGPDQALLVDDRSLIETGLNDRRDRVHWYVYLNEPATDDPPNMIFRTALQVDDVNGSCKPVNR